MFRSGTGNPQVKHETGDEVRIEDTQTGSKKTGMFVVFVLLVDPVSGSAVEQGMGTIEGFFNRLLLLSDRIGGVEYVSGRKRAPLSYNCISKGEI